MNRHYSAEEYFEKCQLIRKYYNMAAITTDVIVGFPGETDEEFNITEKFLEQVAFSEMHIFKYSKRKGTKAAVMENQIKEEIKTVRSDKLIALGEKLRETYLESFVDMDAEVLIEEPVTIDGKAYMTGHTREYVRVAMDIHPKYVGEIVQVTLKGRIKNEILLANMKEMY
jgi:threonylcarbamoyladenosine tRNA methylthiotransferase MtaB